MVQLNNDDWTLTTSGFDTLLEASFEAEDLVLENYSIEALAESSGGEVVRLIDKSKQSATVSYDFDGLEGVYSLNIRYFDERDGAGTFSVRVDGVEVSRFVADEDNDEFQTHQLVGLTLKPGQLIEVVGNFDQGERMRVDRLDFSGIQAVASSIVDELIEEPDIGANTTRIEAESMSLTGYVVEDNNNLSGGGNVKAVVDRNDTATCSFVFNGEAGTYDLLVAYLDENDGQGVMSLAIDGEIIRTWTLDKDTKQVEKIVVEGLELGPDTEISVIGQREGGERGRIDCVDLTLVELAEAPDTPVDDPVDDDPADTPTDDPDTGGSGNDTTTDVVDYQIRLEAEDLARNNYALEERADASGGKVIRTEGQGEASFVFEGPSGDYALTVAYFDENDGRSPVEVLVDGVSIGAWVLNKNDSEFGTTTFEDIAIETGQTVTIVGERHWGERARIDYVELDGQGEDNSGTSTPDDTNTGGDGGTTGSDDGGSTGGGTGGSTGGSTSDPKSLGHVDASMFAPYAEWTVSADGYSGNPYDLDATVTFRHVDTGETMKTGMFYKGDGEFAVRFSGVKEGEWTFESQSNRSAFDGLTGSVSVDSDPDARGFVVADSGKFAQQMGDGTLDAILPNFAMIPPSFSDFYDDPSKIDDLVDTFITQHGFTGLHIPNIGGLWFDIDNNTSNAGSQIGSLRTNPDPKTFEVLEKIIQKTHEAGGVVHFWPWGDSQRDQSPDQLPGGENGEVHQRLLEYMADRLGPLPGWTMGYGFDNDEWTSPNQAAERTAYFDSLTDFDHLLAVRSEGPNFGTDHREDMAWHEDQDFADFEHHAPDYDVYLAAVEEADGIPVQSGDRFRVRGTHDKDYTEEETVDGLWHSTMAGGVSNIWGNLVDPNTGQVERTGNFETYSYSSETIREISTWDTFFNDKDRFALDATEKNELTGGTGKSQYALWSEDENTIIVYAEDTRNIDLHLNRLNVDSDLRAQIVAVDTEASYREIDMGTVDLVDQSLQLSKSTDWALHITLSDGF